MPQYLDVQTQRGQLLVDVAPAEQSFRISNPTLYTVVCTVSLPLARHELVRTFTADPDSGVTGSSSSTGAISQTLTIPSKKGITYSLSTTYDDPPLDSNSAELDSATDTAILTVTATTYNGVGLSPTVAYIQPLATAVLGDPDLVAFGDGVQRSYDTNAVVLEFFRARTKAEGAEMLDWIESGGRNLKDFMDLYDWALTQGFTGV